MIRVDIETVIMSNGPVPSVIVLRERSDQRTPEAATRVLSIQTGMFEAASIGRGAEQARSSRPITHDLLLNVMRELGGKLERVEIDRVDAPVFFAKLIVQVEAAVEEGTSAEAAVGSQPRELRIDARPSDALALAVRANAPIYVEDDVMNRAGNINVRESGDGEAELERFDQFVQTLSPDDF